MWSIRLKSIVVISTIFFIGILGYFFFLRSALEKKEKIYLSLQACKKELNSQLEISSEYSHYPKKIKNIKNKFDIHSDAIDKLILNVLIGQLYGLFIKINKIDILPIKKSNFSNYLQVESDFSSLDNNIFNFIYAFLM